MDDELIERVLRRSQDQILGLRQDWILIMHSSKVWQAGVEIVNAVDGWGRFLRSVIADSKTNETPAASATAIGYTSQ